MTPEKIPYFEDLLLKQAKYYDPTNGTLSHFDAYHCSAMIRQLIDPGFTQQPVGNESAVHILNYGCKAYRIRQGYPQPSYQKN